MDWRRLLEPEIQSFIKENAQADVTVLALRRSKKSDWPHVLIFDQIKARQKAAIKHPLLCSIPDFIFPSSDLVEQSSSQACALYKSTIVGSGRSLDLTAGCGVDAFFMARTFGEGVLVEHNPVASEILAHNVQALLQAKFLKSTLEVQARDAGSYLNDAAHFGVIYADPQRRDMARKGIFDLENASPDIMRLMPVLREKCSRFLLKTSPILDISKTMETLVGVSEVHIIEWNKECKEVLYLFDFEKKTESSNAQIFAVQIGDDGAPTKVLNFRYAEEKKAEVNYAFPLNYVYEPAPAFMKSGAFRLMAQRFSLAKVHPQSHLYTANHVDFEFPGKVYKVEGVVSPQAGAACVKGAEVVLRNFPGTPEALRKKLKIPEDSDHRIFATTLMDDTKKLIVTKKII